ncbi:Protein phosphatase 2C homolog 2 (PP2C-2) [Durusdinium trenchii]|uniref:Protein phosphatase 2C homolog 2 (PP2C-2) n=1 Tax=Durusdinium trenchii TaxID=1381693 RepID=A0ABP0R9Y3_9DINO
MAPEESVPCEDFATCGVAQFQNRQFPKNAKQQDSYFVVEDMGVTFGVRLGGVDSVALYGVADGHGECGELCAAFVRRHLPTQLAQSRHFAEGRLDAAMHEAFLQTELLQQSSGLPLWASGACVSAAAVSRHNIVVANCGDCRCVLEEQGAAQELSSDHNVQNATPEELRRVLAAGGTITPDQRVTIAGAPGRLATTRAFGDAWAKQQGPPEKHIITAIPEVRSIPRRPEQRFLLLASDGVFGFMSSQEVVSLCVATASQLPPVAPLSSLSHAIVCSAVARRSDDNCTCLVVDLPRVDGTPNVPSLRSETRPNWVNSEMQEEVESIKMSASNGMPPAHTKIEEDASLVRPKQGRLDDHSNGVRHKEGLKEDSDRTSIPSSPTAPEEVCWCPWCWGMNQEGEAENRVLGSFERWRLHMHEHHFDRLAVAYAADEIVPCYWCCRPCVTKRGQHKNSNRLPFWGSHERVCRENPSKPVLPGQARSSEGSQTSSGEWRWGSQAPRRSRKGLAGVHEGTLSPEFRDLRDSNDLRELRKLSVPGGEVPAARAYDAQPPVQHRTSTGSDKRAHGHRRVEKPQVRQETSERDAGPRRPRRAL